MENSVVALPISGFLAGGVLGYVARRNFFCTLSALEQHWYGGNSTGLRTWVLAAVVAMLLSQGLAAAGLIEPRASFYLTAEFHLLGAVAGGLAFGFGMALVGTCGFGALVRLGGGSLKSLIAVLVLGLAALSTLRGLLGFGRIGVFERFAIDFGAAGSQSLPDLVVAATGADQTPFIVLAVATPPLLWVLSDRQYRQDLPALTAALVIGSVVAFGWLVTGFLADTAFSPVQVESASFVTPVADTIMLFAAFTGSGPDYGVGMVLGVVAGAALAARIADDVRWEACDDARELSRHILGAALMGFGGVLALGCTIGQGLSAVSLLAISAPVSMVSILIGARLGLAWLLEGSLIAFLRR